MTEATFVFRHADEEEAWRFCKELMERYPFCGDGTTKVIAMATGDAMSVSDAVRAAMLCDALDAHFERNEFALDMADCNNWDDCMKLAEKWELEYHEGQFVDLRASAGEAGTAGTTEIGSVHEHAVAAGADAQGPSQ